MLSISNILPIYQKYVKWSSNACDVMYMYNPTDLGWWVYPRVTNCFYKTAIY